MSDGAFIRDLDLDLHRTLNMRLLRDYRIRRLHSPEHTPLRQFARQPDDVIWRRRRSWLYDWRWRRRRRWRLSRIRPSWHSIAAANSQRRASNAQRHWLPLPKQVAQLILRGKRLDLYRRHKPAIGL